MSDVTSTGVTLPVGAYRKRASGWYGVLCLMGTEAALFVYLLFSYYYFYVQFGRDWFPDELPHFKYSLPNTIILLLSSVTCWIAERGVKRGAQLPLVLGLLGSLVLGIVFFCVQLFLEWGEQPFNLASFSYASLYYVTTGFHMAHLLVGDLVLLALLIWSLLGYFNEERHSVVSIGAIYWHFVDAVWIAVFFTFYITPYFK